MRQTSIVKPFWDSHSSTRRRWLADATRQCLEERSPNQLLAELRGLQYSDPIACHPTQRNPTLTRVWQACNGYKWMTPIRIMMWTGVSFTDGR